MRAFFSEFNLAAEESGGFITYLGFSNEGKQSPLSPLLERLHDELTLYFRGELKTFSVPYKLSGTSFQNKVWAECAKIPYGEKSTYKELATRAGCKEASRAVGSALGANKIVIIIPCHRVLSSDGKLGGYNGGLEKKIRLLDLEKNNRGY